MVHKVQEASAEKVGQALDVFWESGGAKLSTKALSSIKKNVTAFQEQLKPTADGMRKVADAIVKRLDPLLEKGRLILDKVASLDVNSFVMGKLDLIGDIAKGQLEELLTIDDVDLSTITDREQLDFAMDLVVAAAKSTIGNFKRWENALKALARGFEGNAWTATSAMLSAAEGEGLSTSIKEVIQAVKSVVSYLVDNGVFEAIQRHAIAVEEKVNGLKEQLSASKDPLSELNRIQDEVNATLIEGQLKLVTTTISFGDLKDHLMAAVSEQIDTTMHTAKSKLVALMDDTIGDELKAFQRCTRRIRTRIMDLQDTLVTTSEAVKKAADVMESDMHDGLDDVLGAIGQARKHASSVKKTKVLSNVKGAVSSSMSQVNPFKKKKKKGKEEAGEEAKEGDGPTEVANTKSPDLAAMRNEIMQCEEKLNGHTEMVLGSLNQVPMHAIGRGPPTPSHAPSPEREPEHVHAARRLLRPHPHLCSSL